jgi:hypothetical protein
VKKTPQAAKSGVRQATLRRAKRRVFPYARVAKLWAKGKTIAEIAKAIERVGNGKDAYHGLRVVLTRMHKGYRDSDGKVVKLPHRISLKTLRLATKAGKKAAN